MSYKEIPIYRGTIMDAIQKNGRKAYFASIKALEECRMALDEGIRKHYDGSHLNCEEIVSDAGKDFTIEQIVYTVANTVRNKEWDGRFSPANKEWARGIPVTDYVNSNGDRRNWDFEMRSHSCLIDGLATYIRKEMSK